MRQIKSIWKAALLIACAALMMILLWLVGMLAFIMATYGKNMDTFTSVSNLSNALTQTTEGYCFSQETFLSKHGAWAMLLDEQGNVVWSCNRPADVPERYSINDVASFSKWYLKDYPVQSWIREDGLFVLGMKKYSEWKYNMRIGSVQLGDVVIWTAVMLVLSLLCVIGLSALLLRRWFKKEQKRRDAARADWINGVSHDIRTPLSLVMGYSSQLSQNESLPCECRSQADIILSQSQAIKELVGDLNLTMRLSYQMEPLRKNAIDPIALVRQVAAELMNIGLDEQRYKLTLDVPRYSAETICADAALIKRALKNLLDNCVKHNEGGCDILLKLRKEKKDWRFVVESIGTKPVGVSVKEAAAQPGESMHGTGLKLVRQIAAVHGGTAAFHVQGNRFCCEVRLPAV